MPDKLELIAALLRRAGVHIEDYLARQGGLMRGNPGFAGGRSAAPGTRSSWLERGRTISAELIAEVQCAGHKISQDRVLFTGRDHTGRTVWMEKGDDRAGLWHTLRSTRVRQFVDVQGRLQPRRSLGLRIRLPQRAEGTR
ncbi:hypothetical protein [Goodfellowiella coeruleoviolacea]|uniref:hypothetical protein n=1 Tax=Goodfellowiella coeruleoviolacea TaxID=334858 RepID=UPI0020A2B7F7|nr:hypothetical protein [Goodfellowiella coeruleoviolacea]